MRTFRSAISAEKPADKSSPPPRTVTLSTPTLERLFKMYDLDAEDVFADLGCGDGRIIIEAAKRYGCRAVGVEIKKDLAQKAWDRVRALERTGELEPGQVKVFHGDAADFGASFYGVTHAMAYLFPETLEHIADTLRQIPVVAVPFHEIPGRTYSRKVGDIHLYEMTRENNKDLARMSWFGGRTLDPVALKVKLVSNGP